jgi:hypothetical protein
MRGVLVQYGLTLSPLLGMFDSGSAVMRAQAARHLALALVTDCRVCDGQQCMWTDAASTEAAASYRARLAQPPP